MTILNIKNNKMFNQVKEYVSKMRQLGYSEEKIHSELTQAGWSEIIITNALTGTDLPLPPSPAFGSNVIVAQKNDEDTHNSLMMGLLYFINFISLWIGSISLILAIFSLVDKTMGNSSVPYYSSIKGSDPMLNSYIAALLVTAPVFIFLFLYLKKKIVEYPEFRQYKTRKTLIILTLIVIFVTIVIDLISVISGFLNGDVSLGFILKVLAIIFILVPIFTYYYHELSNDKKAININK